MPQLSKTKGLDYVCCTCGIALYKQEREAGVNGTYIDYGVRDWGEFEVCFCSECWGKIREVMGRDQGDAIMRRLELENISKKHSDKNLCFDHALEEAISENPFGFEAPDDVCGGI